MWSEVLSGVPQGSVLGPTLFVVYINDMPSVFTSISKLYADDSKLMARVNSVSDAAKLQNDLNSAVQWCSKWLMQLNFDKCKVMHFGKKNPKTKYFLHDPLSGMHPLAETTCEKDLGVFLSADLKHQRQVASAAAKANSMFGILKNTFVSRDKNIWSKLYKTYIRPQLEFAVPVWNPYLKKDIAVLEKVQRRVTRLPHSLRGISYENRCTEMNLTTLVDRRRRGDLIQKYKIENKLDVINWHKTPTCSRSASHRPQFRGETIKNCEPRNKFFNNRVANPWNALPDEVIESSSTNAFKARLDKIGNWAVS